MNIQNAVKQALETDGYIKRSSLDCSRTLIRPTNSYDCCIIFVEGKENQQSRYWNPTADDLTADDWECISGEKSS